MSRGMEMFRLTWTEQRIMKAMEYHYSLFTPDPKAVIADIQTFRQLVGKERFYELCTFAKGAVNGQLKKMYAIPRDGSNRKDE